MALRKGTGKGQKPRPQAGKAETQQKQTDDTEAVKLTEEDIRAIKDASQVYRIGRMFSRVISIMAAAVMVVLCTGAFMGYVIYNKIDGYVVAKRDQPYEVRLGSNARRVANDLIDDKDLAPFLTLYLYFHPEWHDIKKGYYEISGTQTIGQVLSDMVAGRVFVAPPTNFAIIEGMTFGMVLAKLERYHSLSQARPDSPFTFDLKPADLSDLKAPYEYLGKVLEKPEYLALYPESLSSFEGLLLPATYPFYEGDSDKAIINHALNSMAKYLYKAWEGRDRNCRLNSPYEALILASIVERESAIDDERAVIAGVFCNRLDKRIRLQTDPAVMYGVRPEFRGPLLRRHIQQDSPYNTYTRDGLPPTPIAMPSVKSIDAVMHPASTPAIYFVAADVDPKLGHVFTETLREHNRAVAEYKKKVREYKRAQREAQSAQNTQAPPATADSHDHSGHVH